MPYFSSISETLWHCILMFFFSLKISELDAVGQEPWVWDTVQVRKDIAAKKFWD